VDATDPVQADYSLPGLFFISFTFQSFLISLISCPAQMPVAHLCTLAGEACKRKKGRGAKWKSKYLKCGGFFF
jgi:hypothetical protein